MRKKKLEQIKSNLNESWGLDYDDSMALIEEIEKCWEKDYWKYKWGNKVSELDELKDHLKAIFEIIKDEDE